MNDTLQCFLFKDRSIRGDIVRLGHSLSTIIDQQSFPLPVQTYLAQLLCSSVLLSATLKYEGQLTIQFQHEGALKMLVAKCDDQYRIRATAQWDEAAPVSVLQEEFSSGRLMVTIQDKVSGKHYQSIVEMRQRDIPSALEHYFSQSEQLPTLLSMVDQHGFAVGLLLQAMPEASDEDWTYLSTLARTVQGKELLGWDNQTLLKKLFHEEDILLYEPKLVQFFCPCSIDKMKDAVRLLGEAEAMDILKSNRFVEVSCDYCHQQFDFNMDDVKALFARH